MLYLLTSGETSATSNTAASAGIGAKANSEGIRFSARGHRHASSMPSGTTRAAASNVPCLDHRGIAIIASGRPS